jgi:mono/diheme cytochrome c family protein
VKRGTRRLAWVSLGVGAFAAAACGAVYLGLYNVAATEPHSAAVYRLLEIGMRRSVQQRARDIVVPPLADPALVARGRALHDAHCLRCHGAPGIAPEPFALGLAPAPANLAYTAREWPPAELFWVVKYGIRMTGMPAWEYRLADEDIWGVVAYLEQLPGESPAQYRASAPTAPPPSESSTPDRAPPPDAERGKRAIHQYACATCHVIPGIAGATAPVGPSLARMGRPGLLSGTLPNTHANLVAWLRAPQLIHRESAMPDLGLTERDARDIAAYLATLK